MFHSRGGGNACRHISDSDGFTIQNGTAGEGGGITVQGSSPLIVNNTISNNGGCDGLGIVGYGSPVIRGNI